MTTLEEPSTIPTDLISMLDLLAETIVEALGFGLAAINLARPDGSLEVVSVAGDEGARKVLLGFVETMENWERLLAASEPWGRLRFLDHNHESAAGELLLWIPDIEVVDTEDAWHPEDALFASLVSEDGALLGVLSVDLPRGGLRPDSATCHALEAFVVSAALAIEHATMRQRAEVSERAAFQQATHDSLTGLANRTHLETRLREAGRKVPETMTALVFVDIDRFKLINDLHSHATGDQVLRAVADRIAGAIRPCDTAARWGGDEFLVLLEGLPDETTALEVVQRISHSLAHPVVADGTQITVTASMGVSLIGPGERLDTDELIRRADSAMYQVKKTGRNGYAVFPATGQPPSRRLQLSDLLSRAIIEDRVVVHYQPVVRLSDHSIIGVEALLRLRDDDDSLVPPLDLISLARENGTLIPIERAVIHEACIQVARWVEQGHDLRLSVNVCAEHLHHIEDFEETVDFALGSSRLSAGRLLCEITEHALVDLSETTIAGVNRVVHRGVRMSIDDFGTGFGSFSYIQQLPIHELKIDRSFVTGAPTTSGPIIRAIAGLASALDMTCVAEGVETPNQEALVRQARVPLTQGFLYAKPLPAEALQHLLVSAKDSQLRPIGNH